MNKQDIFDNLNNFLNESEVFIDEPMKKHTTFKIGGLADIYIKAKTIEDIKKIVKFVKDNDIHLTIIGNGSNILVGDNGIRGIVLEVELKNKLYEENEKYEIITVRSRNKLNSTIF
jgi:UDP-N-acetylmuramate dehydrogenase